MGFSNIIDSILLSDRSVRYAGIIDYCGKLLAGRAREGLDGHGSETIFKTDIYTLKEILDLDSRAHGKVISFHCRREGMQYFIHYLDEVLVYVTCDPSASDKDITTVLDKISEMSSHL